MLVPHTDLVEGPQPLVEGPQPMEGVHSATLLEFLLSIFIDRCMHVYEVLSWFFFIGFLMYFGYMGHMIGGLFTFLWFVYLQLNLLRFCSM